MHCLFLLLGLYSKQSIFKLVIAFYIQARKFFCISLFLVQEELNKIFTLKNVLIMEIQDGKL